MPADTYTHGHHPSVLRSHMWGTADNSAADLQAFVEEFRRWIDAPDGWFAVLHGEALATP